MKTHPFILTVGIMLGGVAPLPVVRAEPAAITQPAAGRQEAGHAFYGGAFYPAWSKMTEAAAERDANEAAQRANERIEAICAVPPGEETWENVFAAYEGALYELDCMDSFSSHLPMVSGGAGLRRLQALVDHLSMVVREKILNNGRLWEVILRASQQPWVEELSPAKKLYVRHVLETFRKEGAGMPEGQRERLRDLNETMGALRAAFNSNIFGYNERWQYVVTERELLDGMSAEWMSAAAEEAARRGYGTPDDPQWLITMNESSCGEVMGYCRNESLRKVCWAGRISNGKLMWCDNGRAIAGIMEARQELAEVSGYKNYADMVCRNRMLDTGEKARGFVCGLIGRIRPAFQKETQDLLDFISAQKGRTVDAIDPWDGSYYINLREQLQGDLDQNKVRPYFRSDKVINGMLAMFSKLYDITISELETACPAPDGTCPEGKVEVWAPQVKVYKVTDNKTGAHLGSFYLDPYPRQGKHEGGWFYPLRMGRPGADGAPHEPHLMAMVCNVSAPSEKGYALFSHRDVVTLFHEFGHTLAALLCDAELRALSMDSMCWDFVELPSNLSENWAWEPEVLRTFAFHHETGEPMPDDMMRRLTASRFRSKALEDMTQLGTALLDLEMHTDYAGKFAGKQLDEAAHEVTAPCRIPTTVRQPCIMRRMPHCITMAYAAGLYSYPWGEVLAADIFSRFKKEGILNPQTAADYRACILAPCDGKTASERFRDFMHREPSTDAYLEQRGYNQATEPSPTTTEP